MQQRIKGTNGKCLKNALPGIKDIIKGCQLKGAVSVGR